MTRAAQHQVAPMQSAGSAGPARKAVAGLVAVGMIIATTGAAISRPAPPLRADPALSSADGPLSGSETAIILGGTGQPTPSLDYVRAAENLYLHALGFNDGATDSTVCHMDGTDPCGAPLQVLTTPELFQQSNLADAAAVVLAVQNEFAANPGAFDAEHPLTVFGYSQSATAESMAMTQLAAAGIPLDSVHFVFIGNPSAPNGIGLHLEAAMEATLGKSLTDAILNAPGVNLTVDSPTPNDLYPTTIYSLPTDPITNFVDVYAADGLWAAVLGIFGPHVEYLGLTPEQVADATTTVDGALTYVDINDDDIDALESWGSAMLFHGVANSDPVQSLLDSLQLLLTNSY